MKNALIIASVASMIDQFNMPNIHLLQEMGYHVDVACNYEEGNTCTKERVAELKEKLKEQDARCFQIDFARDVTKLKQNAKAYRQLKKVAKERNYDLVHCHAPIGGVLGRIVFQKYRKTGTRVIYTAHGFHFFKGAPWKNWVLYYPVEKFLSRWTDCLITINKEDYRRAKGKFHAKRTEYVPGVGIDLEKFHIPDFVQDVNETSIPYLIWKQKKREKLGIDTDDYVIVSVGELNVNKNHEIVIKAVARLKNKKVKYLICGQGELQDKLNDLIKKLGLEKQVFLLGFCNDVREILWVGDLFAFPSKREGLGLAAIEAMAAGLPLITSNVHGIKDYSISRITGYSSAPNDKNSFSEAIKNMIDNKRKYMKYHRNVLKVARWFDISKVEEIMKKIYSEI